MLGLTGRAMCFEFCDNNAVVLKSAKPESMLKKKHAAINYYHRAREAIAAGVIRVAKEDMTTSSADSLTKCLPGSALREHAGRI